MSYPLVIWLMIAMTLMPDASYCEALARPAGLLAGVPFAQQWHVPTGKVVTDWRVLVPADLMEALFWRAAGPLISDDEPSAVLLAGMTVCAADGMLVNVADTPENREEFGCTGTASQEGEGAPPFPQVRIVALTARAGRAMLGAISDPTLPPGIISIAITSVYRVIAVWIPVTVVPTSWPRLRSPRSSRNCRAS